MKECLLYESVSQDQLQCRACNHFCLVSDGKTGVCGIRQNVGGKLYLLTYGKAAVANVDPIEKKPLFHFLPGTLSYSFGTVGCNFHCQNCHNFEISQIFGKKGRLNEYPKLKWGFGLSPKKIIEEALENKCQSISYTYNEPTVFLEYALDTMRLAREAGLKNIWVSNGFMSPETLEIVAPYLDAINVDIKSMDDDFYVKNCGARLAPVLENCKKLVEKNIWLEITTLIIPTLTDDRKMLRRLAEFISKELGDFVPWHVNAFSGMISWHLKNIPDTEARTIEKTYLLGKEAGLKYVYGGNVWGSEMEDTFCPECKEEAIERVGYEIIRHDRRGLCKNCGYKLAGIF